MECFKIMDFENGKLKTLFHGVNGSRTVKQWVPITAKIKDGVSDGSSTATYTSGWHVLETMAQAMVYLHKFKNLDKKVIVKCRAAGHIWKKAHSPAEGLWLAEILEIREIVVFSAGIVGSLLFPVKPAIRENAKTLLDAFDEAAQIWGWESDQGCGNRVPLALQAHRKARKDLEKFINNLIEEAI